MGLNMHLEQPELAALAPSLPVAEDVPQSAPRHADQAAGPRAFLRYRLGKRAFDVCFVLLTALLWAPALLFIALAVRWSSPGPVFFSHRRIRRHGEYFTMWKFRTMRADSAAVLEAHLLAHPEARLEWSRGHKLARDPRITPLGNFLRRTSLDELPQMWNVLNGTMTLVGPRPIVAAEVERYGEFFADYCRVTPGLTGLWQVSGRNQLSYEQRVRLDRRYVCEWSFHGDLVILARTWNSVVNQDGAY